ncbi:protein BLISTER-like [Camellia sinensis]|uniref:protein BLISTER-like n=1 Tax=Camellia sinensis TaxID=4442 RepID=UPI0010364DE7|nr:protein BLISTER-like [Camellia sinensis]
MATIVVKLNSYSATLSIPQQPAIFARSRTESKTRQGQESDQSTIQEDDADATADTSNQEMNSAAPFLKSEASSSSLLPENRQFNLEVSSLNIPVDQMKMIQNINTLISELALEKEELMQALLAESSESFTLK